MKRLSPFAAFVAGCTCSSAPPEVPVAPAPRVVLVVIDTLRADHLGFAGYDRPTSPNLDAFAARGAIFERAIATSSWTRPSMASLLTGEYARTVGIYEERFDRLPEEATTLPERLDAEDWVTLGITANPNVNEVFGFGQGWDDYRESDVVFKFMDVGWSQARFGDRNPMHDARTITDGALELVDEHAADIGANPTFLMVHYIDPHIPYEPPAEHLAAVADLDALPDSEHRVAKYDGEVHYADAEVGRLFEGLRERGWLDDAWVIVTSDHGEGLDDHRALPYAHSHGHTLYDSVIRVPLVVVGPDVPAGTRVSDVVSLLDVVPTVLDVAGVSATLPGRTLRPAWTGGTLEDRPAFAETDWRYTEKVAVRTADHLLIRNPDAVRLAEDGAHEQRELSRVERGMLEKALPEEMYEEGRSQVPRRSDRDEAAYPGMASALDGFSEQPRRPPENRDTEDVVTLGDGTVVPDPWVSGGAGLDASTTEQLEALGYMGGE